MKNELNDNELNDIVGGAYQYTQGEKMYRVTCSKSSGGSYSSKTMVYPAAVFEDRVLKQGYSGTATVGYMTDVAKHKIDWTTETFKF